MSTKKRQIECTCTAYCGDCPEVHKGVLTGCPLYVSNRKQAHAESLLNQIIDKVGIEKATELLNGTLNKL